MTIQFITASHNQRTLQDNLLKSPVYKKYPFSVMKGYDNISKAYNDAMKLSEADIYIYLHHDVYLPARFEGDLLQALETIKDFGVMGCAGMKGDKRCYENQRGNIKDRGNEWGKPIKQPVEVDTLDELLLITKGDYKFDENLPQDFYGGDICMQAQQQGKKNYVIPAYVYHNSSRPFGGRTESFYESEKYFKDKWKEYLPIATTCAMIEK